MKKLKVNKRQVLYGVAIVGVAAMIGLTTYQLFELRGLRARTHSLESARTAADLAFEEQQKASESKIVKYEELSKTVKTVRVEDPENTTYGSQGTLIKKAYKNQKVYIYKVKITNNMDYAYNSYGGNHAQGVTISGILVAPITTSLIHPDDQMPQKVAIESLGLAPGGSAEVYVYIPADEEIAKLDFSQ